LDSSGKELKWCEGRDGSTGPVHKLTVRGRRPSGTVPVDKKERSEEIEDQLVRFITRDASKRGGKELG